MQKTGILGCGWLGRAVAAQLQSDGIQVCATVRQDADVQSLQQQGISASPYEVGDPIPSLLTESCTFLLLSIPVTRRLSAAAIQQLASDLHGALPQDCRVVFTSSTGVYVPSEHALSEDAPVLDDHPCVQMEQALSSRFGKRLTILRLAGLIGEDRHPVVHLSGKSYTNGQHPVNLVHRSDVVRFIHLLFNEGISGGVYNLVYPEHPSRADYYTHEALARHIEPPVFESDGTSGKLIRSERSQERNRFQYTNPI